MTTECGTSWLKEIVIATLAFVTLWLLSQTYNKLQTLPADYTAANKEIVIQRMQNTQNAATALFGIFAAFVGYYSGRLPAEKNAASAQQAADAQKKVADTAKNATRTAVALLAEALPRGAMAESASGPIDMDLRARILNFINEHREV